MSRFSRFLPGFVALLALGPVGCGDQGASGAGELTVSFYQSTGDAGALLLTVSGGPVQDVSAVGSDQVSFASAGANTTRIVVTGTLGTGELLRLRVPDVALVAQYSVRVDQVAHKATFALLDPARYTLTVAR
jgi:hypothetical protein